MDSACFQGIQLRALLQNLITQGLDLWLTHNEIRVRCKGNNVVLVAFKNVRTSTKRFIVLCLQMLNKFRTGRVNADFIQLTLIAFGIVGFGSCINVTNFKDSGRVNTLEGNFNRIMLSTVFAGSLGFLDTGNTGNTALDSAFIMEEEFLDIVLD